MKNTAIPLLIAPFLLVFGCTSSFGKVREAINTAPDWYGERRAQIRGEGYPDLGRVPEADTVNPPGKTLKAQQAGASQRLANAFDDPRAEVAAGGAEEIIEIAAAMIGNFGTVPPESDFLTDADIAAIRQSFNVPRVTRDD
ncbi:MAG: hypothetical protein ACK4MQ_13275 [Hyphomonas sp.]